MKYFFWKVDEYTFRESYSGAKRISHQLVNGILIHISKHYGLNATLYTLGNSKLLQPNTYFCNIWQNGFSVVKHLPEYIYYEPAEPAAACMREKLCFEWTKRINVMKEVLFSVHSLTGNLGDVLLLLFYVLTMLNCRTITLMKD